MQTQKRQLGFTLIEIAVVLLLMALTASVVAVSARGMIGGATQQDILMRIESLDQQARRHAKLTGEAVQLNVDIERGRIRVVSKKDGNSHALARYDLPRGYRFSDAWRWRQSSRDKQTNLLLVYDAYGVGQTWGMTLEGMEQQAALLIAGETGQVLRLEHDGQTEDILAALDGRDTD